MKSVRTVKVYSKKNGLPDEELLIIVNSPSHPGESKLICGSMRAVFLHLNVTSLLQPMDYVILHDMKCTYNKKNSFGWLLGMIMKIVLCLRNLWK